MQQQSKRTQAIQAELDAAAAQYVQAREDFQEAQIVFEAAREKLASLKRLAVSVMSAYELVEWQKRHLNVSFVGSTIGEAIVSVLEQAAWMQAWKVAQGEDDVYTPKVAKESLVIVLEQGGFDFRTSTPGREVHAALIRLEGATEQGEGIYIATNAEDILAMARDMEKRANL